MSEYRHKETGEVKNQGEWRAHYKNASLPRTWTTETLSGLKLDAVLEAPKPATGPYETTARNGIEQDSLGNWVTAWIVRDTFADTTDGDGVTTTKAEHEAAFLGAAKAAKLDELAAARWNAEESGTTFGGSPLATDRTTQAKLTAGFAKAANDANFVIASWKFAAGVFGALDAGTIIAAANAVEAHIQACFTNEKTLSANVLAAADFAALDAVDLTVGWP
jgi:hypothetical protein